MKVQEKNDSWYLSFQNGAVHQIQIDFRLGLFISDDSDEVQVFIETQCRLRGSTGDSILTPTDTKSLAPALTLFNSTTAGISIQSNGQLTVEFANGNLLVVEPHDSYESWQIGSQSCGVLFVCSPGGKVSRFFEH